MKEKLVWSIFWVMVADFVALVINFILTVAQWFDTRVVLIPLGVLFLLLGIALLVMKKLIWPTFWTLVGVFLLVIGMIFFGMPLGAYLFFAVMAVFFGLGVTLLVLTARAKLKKMPKAFLLLTGASAVGLPVFAVLHNLVYALFIYFFGEGFWGGIGDEPVFFILAVIVSPIAFLVGAIGSIVLKFWKVKKSPPRRRKR